MNYHIELDDYKQQVANFYSSRSSNYDNGDWHPKIARRLVEYAQPKSGQQILDIATGTGMVAIEAAQIVGTEGRVVAIDISAEMLDVAKKKSRTLGLSNIEFLLADAEPVSLTPKAIAKAIRITTSRFDPGVSSVTEHDSVW